MAVPWSIAGVVVQPDGKIVVDGDNGSAFELSRYNANGTLDTSFGSGGTATLSVGSVYAEGLVLQADGKLVVAGETDSTPGEKPYDPELARFNANGTLDTTFDSAGPVPGTVTFSFAQPTIRQHLAVYPSTGPDTADYGKVVTAATIYGPGSTGNQVALARFNADGTADLAFGQSGQVVTPYPSGDGMAWATALQADGKIVVAGQTVSGSSWCFSLLRYNTDGSLDTTFGNGGLVLTPKGNSSAALGLTIQTDGRIVAAGRTSGSTGSAFMVARYLPSEPQIGAFTASPNRVTAGSSVTLTASNITDGNPNSTVTQVAFYYFDSSGNKVTLGTGTQTSPSVWTLTFTVNLPSGTYTLYAQAEDSYGVFGDPVALSLQVQ